MWLRTEKAGLQDDDGKQGSGITVCMRFSVRVLNGGAVNGERTVDYRIEDVGTVMNRSEH